MNHDFATLIDANDNGYTTGCYIDLLDLDLLLLRRDREVTSQRITLYRLLLPLGWRCIRILHANLHALACKRLEICLADDTARSLLVSSRKVIANAVQEAISSLCEAMLAYFIQCTASAYQLAELFQQCNEIRSLPFWQLP